MNFEEYYRLAVESLEEQNYVQARQAFENALACSGAEQDERRVCSFCEGMLQYEKAPSGSQNTRPRHYLLALEKLLEACRAGLETPYVYYYLGDICGKIGTGGWRSALNKAYKYFYRSFALQAFARCALLLEERYQASILRDKLPEKRRSLVFNHGMFGAPTQKTRAISGTLCEEILQGKRQCNQEEWFYFLARLEDVISESKKILK